MIIIGDARTELKKLGSEIVNCCVTSPPYWGLRDYGVDGQIGLEKTPEEYIDKLLEVFKEVKRVLNNDGTLWLNLGDSYSTNGGGDKLTGIYKTNKGSAGNMYRSAPGNLKKKELVGIPWRIAFALQQPYEKHLIKNELDRSYLAGLIDGEGCITILKTKSSHCDSYSYPPIVQIRMCDEEVLKWFASLIGAKYPSPELYNSQKNNNQKPSFNVKATAQKAMNLIVDIYPFLRVKTKQAIIAYNHQLSRSKTNYQKRSHQQIEKEEYCKSLINSLNQKNNVDIPSWMIEPKTITEDGWYLRQDLIWHKPNAMPESVRDRCTKAHEYIFLLSKSAKYYYDFEAIKEPVQSKKGNNRSFRGGGVYTQGRSHDNSGSKEKETIGNTFNRLQTRNKRSVWTVATKPYKGAHYATFPPDLIKPCILAGCPPRGIVLDPFIGSGTVAQVAKENNRDFIGIELNPASEPLINQRIS